MQNFVHNISRPIAGAPAATIPAGTILAAAAGVYSPAVAKAIGFAGVTAENTDPRGYALIAEEFEVDIIAGGTIAEGDEVTSDANGHAITFVYNGAGARTIIIGQSRAPATAGNLVRVKLRPYASLS